MLACSDPHFSFLFHPLFQMSPQLFLQGKDTRVEDGRRKETHSVKHNGGRVVRAGGEEGYG